MKKYLLMLFLAVFAISCSKKVEVKAKINGGSPLERMEFVEASSIGTLPLTNFGIDKNGTFTGSFDAPKDGMYFINYAGKQGMVYLKGGQNFEFSADAATFPESIKVTGDAQKNNEFIKETQKFLSEYASKVNMGQLVTKKEADFLKEAKKIKADIEKNLDDVSKKLNPDSEVVKFKKDELTASILGLMSQYAINYPMATQNPSYKVSKDFKDYEKSLETDNDRLVKTQPLYRNYLLSKMSSDYQVFNSGYKPKMDDTNSEIFAKFLDTRKDLSQVTKDYLLAFIMAEYDVSGMQNDKKVVKLEKIADEKIKDSSLKQDLKRLFSAVSGPKKGDVADDAGLVKQDGKSFKFSELKGKPALVMFYASWNPYINEATVPVLKEVVNFYKSKMDFVYVNLDDSQEQFVKTSNAMLKGIPGNNVHAEGGLNSKFADKWTIFSFKMPSYILIDKDGKIASQLFGNLGDPQAIADFEKLTGLKAPVAAPPAILQNDLMKSGTAPEPAPKEPATK